MLKVNDKIKVHMYGTDGKEIQTRNTDTVYTVREEDGRLGINWNTEGKVTTNNGSTFVPFKTFSFRVIFENVENCKKYYWSNAFDTLVEMEN